MTCDVGATQIQRLAGTATGLVPSSAVRLPARRSGPRTLRALTLDLNPFQNPFRRDDLVLPELAGSYLDRGWRRPGMITADGVVTRTFTRIGWSWGGGFQSLKDYQHFSATGR